MTYKGHVENGLIVPDEPIQIEDGASILFEITAKNDSDGDCHAEDDGATLSLTQLLSRFAGQAQTLPEDAAENLDHYLYGVPKK